MDTNYRMSIIVPVYNEVDNLDRIEATFTEYFAHSNTKSKVIFVDDGSTDGSFEKIVEIYCQILLKINVLFVENNYELKREN